MVDITKPVLLFNALSSDEVKIDGRLIKKRGQSTDETNFHFNDLRISFAGNAVDARAQGIFERLDGLYLDLDTVRESPSKNGSYLILGRKRAVTVEIT